MIEGAPDAAGPGARARVMHSFKNVGEETAKLLMVATPAGPENYFAETFFPAADIADIP
jgi:hypothetical protein